MRAIFGLAAAVWAVFAVGALWLTRGGVALDTDSAMRLAQVRDLMGGQSWFDTVQHRMNTPHGLPMHWSRLVDAPLALLMLVSEPFAFNAWPLLLFGLALLLIARIAFALAGGRAALIVLPLVLLCTEIYGIFAPGNIDHHGVQLVLMLGVVLGIAEQRPVLAAAAVALGLGVGLESLPYALAGCAAAALWLRDAPLRAQCFGLVLAGMALVLLLVSPYRAAPVCDSYSLFYAGLLGAGGLGLAAIARLPRHRGMGFAALAVLLLGLAAFLNPGCFAGPYGGLDARMRAIFLDRINEALPVWRYWRLAPSEVVGGYLYAAFALAMCFLAPSGRARLTVIVFSGIALLVATIQMRAVPFAILFALPGLAAMLGARLPRMVPLLAAIILCSGGAFTLIGTLLEGQDHVADRMAAFQAQERCGSEAAMAPLKALPPGRVAGFVDQGPAVLAYTKDAAIAGPYHRDADGILDTYAIFTGPQPREILSRRGIRYVMACRAAPDWNFYRARGGLVAELAAGKTPDWLTPVGGHGDVAVYRIRRVGESRNDRN